MVKHPILNTTTQWQFQIITLPNKVKLEQSNLYNTLQLFQNLCLPSKEEHPFLNNSTTLLLFQGLFFILSQVDTLPLNHKNVVS